MVIKKDNVFSTIVSIEDEEYRDLKRLLTDEEGNTLLQENKFYTGLVQYLIEKGMRIEETADRVIHDFSE